MSQESSKSYKPLEQKDAIEIANKVGKLHEMRRLFRNAIKYIMKQSFKARASMKEKHSEEKAVQSKQHTDVVLIWATDLGFLEIGNPKANLAMLKEAKGSLKRLLYHIVNWRNRIPCR